MDGRVEEHYCVRWKGFHSNIVTALEDLKTDEEFVDVTLSCDGRTIQGHKVILSACSPYFKKILRDNPCRHPVLILNDMELEVLEALVTYMYHGTVSVPQHRLQSFLQTAEALKIKGIVDTSSDSPAPPPPPPRPPILTGPGIAALPRTPLLQPLQHPAGDLSLLAIAATESSAALEPADPAASSVRAPTGSSWGPATSTAGAPAGTWGPPASTGGAPPGPGVKRRKTAPRKLGSYLVSSGLLPRGPYSPSQLMMEDEEEEREKENQDLLKGNRENIHNQTPSYAQAKSLYPVNLSKCRPASPSPSQEGGSLDLSLPRHSPPSPPSPSSSSPPASPPSSQLSLLSSLQGQGSTSPLNLLHVEGVSAADQMAALLGPEQMAALLGPSWKSRQPRMCQYCQRMFSNKFNLKQHILNMHTVGRELACEICQKKVKNKWYLRRHHVTHHGAPLKK